MADNDTDSVEMKGIEVPEGLDLFDVAEAPAVTATPAGAPPETEPEGTPPQADTTPQSPPVQSPNIPAWLADIPEAERAGVIASGLASLSLEERLKLDPVRELVGQVQTTTAAQVSQAQREQNEQYARDQQIANHAASLAERLAQWVPAESGIDLQQETGSLAQVAQRAYHAQLAGKIEGGILSGFSRLGLGPQNLPPSLVASVNNAQDYGGVVKAYIDAAADRGFELGRLKERDDSGNRSKADETALRARMRNEILGQLGKEGRLSLGQDDNGYYAQMAADNTPPSLSGTPVPVTGDLDQAEFDEAMRDPDAYDRLMSDPAKATALKKLMAGALGG